MLPTNSLVRLLVTSTDVIHSWAVPSLGVKIDAVPGRLNQVRGEAWLGVGWGWGWGWGCVVCVLLRVGACVGVCWCVYRCVGNCACWCGYRRVETLCVLGGTVCVLDVWRELSPWGTFGPGGPAGRRPLAIARAMSSGRPSAASPPFS